MFRVEVSPLKRLIRGSAFASSLREEQLWRVPRETIERHILAGGQVGEGSVLKGGYRPYDAVALRASTVALMPRTTFAHCIAELFDPRLHPGADFRIELSQEEMAHLAGVSRPTANRALRQLEGEGLLSLDYGAITVSDPDALRRCGSLY